MYNYNFAYKLFKPQLISKKTKEIIVKIVILNYVHTKLKPEFKSQYQNLCFLILQGCEMKIFTTSLRHLICIEFNWVKLQEIR